MDDPVGQWSLLASAITGRSVDVKAGNTDGTYTDGRAIVIGTHAAADDVRDAVALHAGLLAAGSLRKDIVWRLLRQRPRVRERYLVLEIQRVAAQLGHVIPDRTLRRIRSDLAPPASSDESLTRARSREEIGALPGWVGTIRPSRLIRTSAEDLQGTAGWGSRHPQTGRTEAPGDDARSGAPPSRLATDMPNPFGTALRNLFGTSRTRSEGSGGGAEIPVDAGHGFKPGGAARRVAQQLFPTTAQASPVTGLNYPEWDYETQRYRTAWCTVVESEAVERVDTAAAFTPELQRPLARVGVEHERHRRQAQGDSLDLSALTEWAIDRRRGDRSEPRIYEQNRVTKRDLSVLILLDCSGSTAEQSSAQTVFDEERRLAGDLTVALERLGDRVGAYGFHSRGRVVNFLRIKSFTERFDTAARRRLGSIEPSGFTRIGAAIRHGAHVLQSQALARNMVMIVIGDGFPYDDGYENRYARADAHQAIDEAVRSGVGVVGIGIRASTKPEVLEEVWSDVPFRVIDSRRDLHRHLRPLLLNALGSTRTNGRRRELLSNEHHAQMRALQSAKRSRINSYT